MPNRRTLIAGAAAGLLVGCSTKIARYNGPEVTRVVVDKGRRQMFLFNQATVLKAYAIDLGFAPVGHKEISGDGKTPEGSYFIDRQNPKSSFHLSIGISYPNRADVARAKELGKEPGGDIFIHGAKNPLAEKGVDWTWGCISVSNKEMEEIYSMVQIGTQIDIHP